MPYQQPKVDIMKVKTTGDVGSFKSGTVLTMEQDVALYLRTLANDVAFAAIGGAAATDADREQVRCKLTDAQILACADAVKGADDGGGDDWETGVLALMSKGGVSMSATDNAPPSVSASDTAAIMATHAAQFDGDTELQGLLNKTGETVGFLATVPYFILERFLKDIGSAKLLELPRPGTDSDKTIKDDKGHDVPNPDYAENSDWYQRPTRRKGGTLGSAWESGVDLWCKGFKQVRDWQVERDAITERFNNKEIGETNRDQLYQVVDTKIDAAMGKLRTALLLHHQWEEAKSYPSVKFEWDFEWNAVPLRDKAGNPVLDKDGNTVWETIPDGKDKGRPVRVGELILSKKPIIAVNKDKQTDGWSYSIEEFCRLDFKAAIKAGGTVKALADTVRRDTGGGKGKVKVGTREECLSAINALASFLNETDKYLDMVKFTMSTTPDADETLEALSVLHAKVGGLIGPHSNRIEGLEEKRKNAGKVQSPNATPEPIKTAA